MRTLVLTVTYPSRASYYDDWRDAFRTASAFDVETVNIFTADGRRRVEKIVQDFDLIVLLHACTADTLTYIQPLVRVLQDRCGKLLAFVGNELNLPWAGMEPKIGLLKSIQADIIATQLPLEAGETLYRETGGIVAAVPHALNEMAFRPETRSETRTIDFGARSFRYLPYLGDNDRNRIYDYFLKHHPALDLTIDFSIDHRFDRLGWAQFLNRCKGAVSTEAGSWYVAADDGLVREIRDYLASRRGGLVIEADSRIGIWARRLPYPVKAALRLLLRRSFVSHEAEIDQTADWSDIHGRFFADRPRPPYCGKCISSRHFDAIGTKTVQVMFPGRFNDILIADRHYIPLSPDFSDIRDAVEKFRDDDVRNRIADEAYEHILSAHTYRHRIAQIAAVVG